MSELPQYLCEVIVPVYSGLAQLQRVRVQVVFVRYDSHHCHRWQIHFPTLRRDEQLCRIYTVALCKSQTSPIYMYKQCK